MKGFLRFLGVVGLSVKYYYLNEKITDDVVREWVREICDRFGIEIRCEGSLRHDKFIILANHESYFDIPALYKCSDKRLIWVAKEELFRIPVVGHALRDLDAVAVDRFDDLKSARAVLKIIKSSETGGIVIFPQGTRRNKEAFHMGGVFLAKKKHLPIYPVKIRGTDKIMPPDKTVLNEGEVYVKIFEPIDPSLLSDDEIKRKVMGLIYD